MNYKKILGDRIYLSPQGVSEEEINKFTKWMNDFETTDYIGRSGKIVSELYEREYLENASKNIENRIFNIIELTDNKFIGTVGLQRFNWISRSAVLGIIISNTNYILKFKTMFCIDLQMIID